MKINFTCSLLLSGLIISAISCFAQKDSKQYMQKAPADVNIDGKLTEWGDSLALYDIKTKLNYTIANNDTDLYVIAYVTDPKLRRKIMAAGITVSVNPEGKKHKTYSLTYPVPDGSAIFKPHTGDEDGEDIRKPTLLQSTSIRVTGFKNVESDVITTANTYGFKAAVKFDDKHNLVYETAIPIKMLNIKPGKNEELEINIQVNGVERPVKGGGVESGGMSGGGRGMGGGGMGAGGMGGGRGGRHGGGNMAGGLGRPDASGMSEASDFWVKLALNTH
ncbi:hypothetical protein BEL04_20555 [Mucilaginibacter sp. PPCGB 2223]|uniref:hypothetical protein n=1 Tax=Mucilaginibacter sp. PPCGB 2223 TaxID=1886027 RepID=UPI0008254237|nr:hypothetical protein [Mucilaginibacter sp. PPCGB 2223]OCX51107.1 hypothetical protein BEL04_20555 [Mucilaginibacter sp. PPCGB 2223]